MFARAASAATAKIPVYYSACRLVQCRNRPEGLPYPTCGGDSRLKDGAPEAYCAPSPNNTTRTVSARISTSSTSELFFT